MNPIMMSNAQFYFALSVPLVGILKINSTRRTNEYRPGGTCSSGKSTKSKSV